jgi:hypothetical protein
VLRDPESLCAIQNRYVQLKWRIVLAQADAVDDSQFQLPTVHTAKITAQLERMQSQV